MEVVNSALIEGLVRDKKPAIFITGHLANWEAFVAAAQNRLGITMDVVYRAPNNPWVDRLLDSVRSQSGDVVTIPQIEDQRPADGRVAEGRPLSRHADRPEIQ